MKHSSGSSHAVYGEYLEVNEPNKLVYTWSWENGLATDTLVSVEFREADNGTEIELTHRRLPSEEIRSRHEQGWGGSLNRLDGFFGGPAVCGEVCPAVDEG